MISSMIFHYDVYDVENYFNIIFKHLVESKGLNSLLSFTRYETDKNFWRRNDDFLTELICQIYEESTQEEKQKFDRNIENFMEEIKQCKKRSYYLLQTILAKALKSKLIDLDVEVDKELLS